jgi:hypothetical protein
VPALTDQFIGDVVAARSLSKPPLIIKFLAELIVEDTDEELIDDDSVGVEELLMVDELLSEIEELGLLGEPPPPHAVITKSIDTNRDKLKK